MHTVSAAHADQGGGRQKGMGVQRTRREDAERGQVMVELALAMPVLLLVLVGILQFGKAFNYWIDMTHLSSEGARWAVVKKNPGPAPTLQESIACQANTGELRKNMKVYLLYPEAGAMTPGKPVKVQLEYKFTFLKFLTDTVGLPAAGITIRTATTQRLEQSNAGFYQAAGDGKGCP